MTIDCRADRVRNIGNNNYYWSFLGLLTTHIQRIKLCTEKNLWYKLTQKHESGYSLQINPNY